MSMSDFDNWEPVDDNDEASADSEQPELPSGIPISVETIDRPKVSKSPIRSLQNSSRNSIASVDNTALKSSPADPQLTALDPITGVNSPPAKDGAALNSVNQIIGSSKDGRDTRESKEYKELKESTIFEDDADVSNSSFLNSMLTTFTFKGPASTNDKTVSHSRTTSDSVVQTKPNIISYRKATPTRRSKRSVSNESNVPTSPLQEMEKPDEVVPEFNKKFYVEERFSGTIYHYATEERNTELHRIFKSVPSNDRLLDDFSCALSREFLFQGRIYITESNICFNSNLLGWVTHIVVSLKDITIMEKTSTAGLFPNGISIETRLGKHQFVSFISRDATFEFIKTVWSKFRGINYEEGSGLGSEPSIASIREELRRSQSDLLATISPAEASFDIPPSRASMISENDAVIEDAILSVDDFSPTIFMRKEFERKGHNIVADDDDEDEDDEDDEDNEADDEENEAQGDERNSVATSRTSSSKSATASTQKVFELKPNSGFEYDGPAYFQETKFLYDPEENKETVLAEVELNAPPGVVYQLIFSSDKTDFLQEFLKGQNSSNLSTIPAFDQVNKDGQQYREYSYAKALNFAVGPKSTKCNVLETVLSLDYENCINVVNTTKTPDVPSGNNFSVKTRYMMCWASGNTSMLKISFWVEWTGGSWIKAMIDKSCKAGQVDATETLVQIAKNYVEKYVMESRMEVKQKPQKKQPQSRRVSRISSRSSKMKLTPVEKDDIESSQVKSEKSNAASGYSLTNILLLINFLLLVLVLIREQHILSLLENSQNINSAKSAASVEQMMSHFKTIFEASADKVSSGNDKINEDSRRLSVREWLDKHGSSEQANNLDLQKKKQYQRYMGYIVDQLTSGEISLNEAENFLNKLDKLISVVNSTRKNSGVVNASELRDAVKYLINT
ncbi:LANO_0D10660g1_1 [Lachancea nothofagi CBS 11611]|uniref:LANO_0D10660g1_1 n=1 Tax=Lachancea nothofagi CBS 11611 TaxID=1266666 RepID=A0A1G4JKH3_9SACH|nr:LANO_0D10660g1_1 [Lachancea nothofagi CBS 11611]